MILAFRFLQLDKIWYRKFGLTAVRLTTHNCFQFKPRAWRRIYSVSKLTIIGLDNGLSLGRHQAIILTSAGILLIGLLWTNFSEIVIEIYVFSFEKMHLKLSPGNWQPCCLGLNLLTPVFCFPRKIWYRRCQMFCKVGSSKFVNLTLTTKWSIHYNSIH